MKKLSLYIFLVLMLCNTVQALPKCESDILVEWTNCQGTWVLPDNEKYLGEFKDGKFHGQGTLTTYYFEGEDGYKAKGEWKNGEPWNVIYYLREEIHNRVENGEIVSQ